MRCHGTSSACANHVQHVTSYLSSDRGAFHVLCRGGGGAVSKRFVIVNNHYFECFQALAFDNLSQSKCHLCNNDIKVSF